MATDAPGTLEFLDLQSSPDTALAVLRDPVRAWFRGRFGDPTPGQRLLWPAVAAGKHCLLSAPTGGGKTLAAFLPVLIELTTAAAVPSVRCLYLTPLKALANDVRRN